MFIFGFVAVSLHAKDAAAEVSKQEILVIVSDPPRAAGVQAARTFITDHGGRVYAQFGLHAIIAELEPGGVGELAALEEIAEIHFGPVDAEIYPDAALQHAVHAWNLGRGGGGGGSGGDLPPEGPDPTYVLPSDVVVASDLPPSLQAKLDAQAIYDLQWEEYVSTLEEPPLCDKSANGYYDTSLYLAGKIAVGVFFVGESWSGWGATTNAFAAVGAALENFTEIQPNGEIELRFRSEVYGGSGYPKDVPAGLEARRTYVNNLRNELCTDWAFMVVVHDGLHPASAYLHGPSLEVSYDTIFLTHFLHHETAHVFGALDQNPEGGGVPTELAGYLAAVNANACASNGLGYFGGAGECRDNLMNDWPYSSFIDAYTAGQVGWHDTTGDGRLDVADTYAGVIPDSVIHTTSSPVTWLGTAVERPLLNELGFPYGDVSINRVTGVQYRVDNTTWVDATPADGAFDSQSEGFSFQPPSLPNGYHAIEIRALSSSGNVERSIYSATATITGSSATNTRPFVALTLSPGRARQGTMFKADASLSRDVETPPAGLEYSFKWGSGAYSAWDDSPIWSQVLTAPGTHQVRVRVKDGNGAIETLVRQVIVETYDTAPVATFVVTPENRHYTSAASYAVTLNASAVSDAETTASNLEVRWDFDGDGSWDTLWSTTKILSVTLTNTDYPRGERRRIGLEVRDGPTAAANKSGASRFVWVVPYNRKPSLPTMSGVTVTQVGSNHLLTVNASDPDFGSSWDNFLEYRYDFDDDGTYDTAFTTTSSLFIPAQYTGSVRADVRDRFHGRAGGKVFGPIEP